MQTIRVTTSQNIDIDFEVAGIGERTLARLLDFALFLALYLVGLIIAIFAGQWVVRMISFIALLIIYASLFVFYDLICEIALNGQSFGKRIMKIKVISLDGNRPSFSQYLLRWLFRIVDFTLTMQVCGLLCAAISEKQQRLGDMVAGTTLIKTHPRATITSLTFMPSADDYIPVFSGLDRLSEKDITLIHEVVKNYSNTRNSALISQTALKIKQLLSITAPENMSDFNFLKTIIKDYNHAAVHQEMP